MTDMGEANQEGVGEYADFRKVVVGRQDSLGYRKCTVRSGSNIYRSNTFSSSRFSKLIVVVIQLVFLSSFCRGHVLDDLFGGGWSSSSSLHAGRSEGRSMLSSGSVTTYCGKFHRAAKGETCASLRKSANITQAQIFEMNPGLNCLTISKGQSICVEGISANCGRTIAVTAGQTSPTCATIEAAGNLTTEGFLVLNPAISCPEAAGNNHKWPKSHVVCAYPGLSNIFFEYMGASGKPINFTDVQPLVQKYPSVKYHFILAFAIDLDANGNRTNGTFFPYWNSALTPAAVQTFKAANPGVQVLMSLGGASKYVNENLTVPVVWTDPPNVAEWLDIAQASIAEIANDYSIDGIDIDYEAFPNGTSIFAESIGTLIQRLKGNGTIGLATIAPYAAVNPEYERLMGIHGDQVDYVNFQFYAYSLPTVQSYISQYDDTANIFVPWKLMASVAINGTNSITGPLFLQSLDQIQKARGLKGVMVYDADHSVGLNFTDENGILSLLSNASTPGPAPPPGSPGPAPPPGSPGTPPSPGSPGPAPPPGSPGPAPPPGSPGSPPSPGSPGPAPPPGSPGPAPPPGSPGSPPSPGSPGPAPPPGSPGPAPPPGSPGTPPSPGSPASPPGAPPSPPPPGSPGGAPAPGGPGSAPPPPPPGSPGGAPAPGGPGSAPPSPGSPGGPGGPGGPPLPPAPAPNSAPGRFLGSSWSADGSGLLTTVLILLFTFYAS